MLRLCWFFVPRLLLVFPKVTRMLGQKGQQRAAEQQRVTRAGAQCRVHGATEWHIHGRYRISATASASGKGVIAGVSAQDVRHWYVARK